MARNAPAETRLPQDLSEDEGDAHALVGPRDCLGDADGGDSWIDHHNNLASGNERGHLG